jgi:TfoX/Sxy family transcriptional regulator of competence genes
MKTSATAIRDEKLVERVRAAFQHVPGVTEKKMFGSIAFMVRGKICVSARAERIMCRIDPALHDAAIERKGCQTVVMRGRQYRGYVYVGANAVRTGRVLKYWVKLALSYNSAQNKNGGRKKRYSP